MPVLREGRVVRNLVFQTQPAEPAVRQVQVPVARAAASNNTVKIGVIDTEKILTSTLAGKNALAGLKKEQDKGEAENRSLAQEIKDIQAKINNSGSSLPQDQLSRLGSELDDKEIALRRRQDDLTRDLTKKRDDVLRDFEASSLIRASWK